MNSKVLIVLTKVEAYQVVYLKPQSRLGKKLQKEILRKVLILKKTSKLQNSQVTWPVLEKRLQENFVLNCINRYFLLVHEIINLFNNRLSNRKLRNRKQNIPNLRSRNSMNWKVTRPRMRTSIRQVPSWAAPLLWSRINTGPRRWQTLGWGLAKSSQLNKLLGQNVDGGFQAFKASRLQFQTFPQQSKEPDWQFRINTELSLKHNTF